MVDKQSPPSSPLEVKETNGKPKRTQNDRSAASRTDIDQPLSRLHELLGDLWPTYQQTITDFLTGKCNRIELESSLTPMLTIPGFTRLHNETLLAILANSFRDPAGHGSQCTQWTKSRRIPEKRRDKSSRLKREVMSLAPRERRRIKSIPKPEPSYRLRPNSMIETRFAKLPRIPMSAQKINSSQHHNDIIKGFHAPLCSENQHLPDPETLKDRILATALENGLLGGVGGRVPELLINGLEVHLRNILSLTLSKLRPGVLTGEQLGFTYALAPHLFVEPSHSITRMSATGLDDATPEDPSWSVFEDQEIKRCGSDHRVKVAQLIDGFL